MSRSNPAWPTPLLALDPIRLRPMGWLDDLLPMRPPSLWRDRSLYARALRWQPDTVNLSWLFDAYAMLGIEMPPQRIEHRTHQRSPQRGRLKGGTRQTHVRRRRAPIKGGKRPLTIPRWSSPPQMTSPQRGSSQERVESGPSFRARRQVSPSTLPSFQWRSPERVAPPPTFSRSVQGQVAPTLGAQPTLLRKEENTAEAIQQRPSTRTDTQSVVARSALEQSSPQSKTVRIQRPTVLSSRQPKIQPFPTVAASINRPVKSEAIQEESSPPPKVTWQRQHTRSPWRLNHTGRTLLNPQMVTRPTSEGASSVNVSVQSSTDGVLDTKRKGFADRVVQIGKVTSPKQSLKEGSASRVRLRRQVQQVEWTPVRKGTIQSAVLEQGQIRQIQPSVQMELPPSPRSSSEPEAFRKPQSSASPVEDTSSTVSTSKLNKKDSVVPSVKKSSSKPSRVEDVVFQAGRVHRVEALQQSRRVLQESSIEQSKRRRGNVVTPSPESFRTQEPSLQKSGPEVSRRPSSQQVQVPSRVPWRLKPSDRQIVFRGSKPVFEQQSSTRPSRSAPIAQRTSLSQESRAIPAVPSWFRPERQRLIRHFETRHLQPRQPRLEVRSEPLRTEPLYGFSNPQQGGGSGRGFRATEQTMVAPLRAGTLVFPTPMGDVEKTSVVSKKSESSQKNRIETVATPKSKAVKREPSGALLTPTPKQQKVYPEPKIQQKTGYQRRKVDGIQSRWRLRKTGQSNKSLSPLIRLTNAQSTEQRWRLPQISINSTESASVKTSKTRPQSIKDLRTTKSVFRAPTPFWQGAFQRSSVQLQSSMVYPNAQSLDSPKNVQGQSVSKMKQDPIQKKNASVSEAQQFTQIRIPIQTERGKQQGPILKSVGIQGEVQNVSNRIRREGTPIRSVSWSRKPRFADPFAAHRQSILSKTPLEVLTPTNTSSSDEPATFGKQTKSTNEPSSVPARVQKSELDQPKKTVPNQVLLKSPTSETRRSSLSTTLEKGKSISIGRTTVQSQTSSGATVSLQAPTSKISPVRRVVAPTLSPSLVYNSTVSEQKIGRRTPMVGKYGRGSSTSPAGNTDIGVSGVRGSISQPKGKYGPSTKSVAEQKNVNVTDGMDVGELSRKASKDTGLSVIGDGRQSVENVVEQAVQRQVQRLVRRLPKTQQSLLRSRIALPTRWARKLGLAPTAEIKMGWRLQHSERTDQNSSGQRIVPNVQGGTQQFVVPSSESSKDVPPQRVQRDRSDSVPSPSTKTGQPATQISSSTKTKPRILTNAQVNRIIERQVSFFRSAQRQSFLRASQLTDSGSISIPSPARSGLQQVTGEMRQALQRMVFSSDAQPVFLDAFSDPAVVKAASEFNPQVTQKSSKQGYQKGAVDRSSNPKPKTNSKTRMRRLQGGPQWRPGVHLPTSLRKPVQTTRDLETTGIEKKTVVQDSTFSRSASTSPSTPSIVTTPSKPQSAPVVHAQSMTVLQRNLTTEDVGESIESASPGGTVPSKNRTVSRSPREPRRKVPARRGSTPMAPSTLMGRSEVGVFLKPKKTVSQQPEEIPLPKPQSSDSVDSDADVFMVDAAGKLLTGQAAKKRLTELGFARSESVKPKSKPKQSSSSSSYTWEAPEGMMEEAVKQVRKELAIEQQVKKPSRVKATPVRQSVIKEWTEEQLLTILVELAGSSPEANALLRDVQDRVEEYFDLEHFRKI